MLFKTPEPVITTRRFANSGTYLAVDLRPRPDWQQWRLPAFLLVCGTYLGLSAGIMLIAPHAARKADVQARSDYAAQLNACYNPDSANQTATELYDCVANWDAR